MKVGIAASTLFHFQLTHNLFANVNILNAQSVDNDYYLFRETISPFPFAPNFPIMSLVDMWGFDGTVIATDIQTLDKLIECPCPTKKLFYVWNLEWIFQGKPSINALEKFYLNKDVELIARSQTHFDVISSVWKKPIGIVEDFNHEQLQQFIK